MDEGVAEVTQVSVKTYHGCCRVNRNGTRKLVDYKRGERCLFPTIIVTGEKQKQSIY